jgi:hypothetical protein
VKHGAATLALLSGLLGCGTPTEPGNPGGAGSSAGNAGAGASGGGTASSGTGGVDAAPSWADLPAVLEPDAELAALPTRERQYESLCALPQNDSFFKRICGAGRPHLPDLAALLRLVGLDQDRAFALTGNSTSLVAHSVSALNPRIIVFPRVAPTLEPKEDFVMLGFVRGERFVEIASRDPLTGEPNFYLLSFEQKCEYEGNCDLASRFSEEIEHDFTAYSIYPERDLENTSFDCLSCHRPGGYGTKKILRMQELASPWLHWFPQRFVQRTASDRVLSAQFADIHGVDGQYGGVPIATIQNALDEGSGAQLEAALRAHGFGEQPNAFDPRIEAEARDGEMSQTWLTQWTLASEGKAIAVPYPRVDVTDEAKRVAATAAYKNVVLGTAGRETMPDLRDVFSQDAREKLSLVPKPGADGQSVLLQMCARCHDGRADPNLSRSKFNVLALDQMSADEKQVAIHRLNEPVGSLKKMPPWRSGQLTPEALQAATTALSQ